MRTGTLSTLPRTGPEVVYVHTPSPPHIHTSTYPVARVSSLESHHASPASPAFPHHTDSQSIPIPSPPPVPDHASSPEPVSLRISKKIIEFSKWIGTPNVDDMLEDMRTDNMYTQYPLVPGELEKNKRLAEGLLAHERLKMQRSRSSLVEQDGVSGAGRHGRESLDYVPGSASLSIPGRASTMPSSRPSSPVEGPSSPSKHAKGSSTPGASSSRPRSSTTDAVPGHHRHHSRSHPRSHSHSHTHAPPRSRGGAISPIPGTPRDVSPERGSPSPPLSSPFLARPSAAVHPESSTVHHRTQSEPTGPAISVLAPPPPQPEPSAVMKRVESAPAPFIVVSEAADDD